jgi:hypothetical protein
MLALLLASNLRAEDKIEAVEQEITKQFDICEKAAPDHVADCFYKVADKMRPYLATLYDQKLKEYGKHGDWKFEEPLVQELYDNARGANLFCGQRSVEFELRNEKDFVNHIIYAAADKLLRQLSDKLYHDEATSYVRIETLDLHLKGNEKSIHIVQDKETGVVSVTYERDPKQAEQEESVVKVDFGVAMVPRGAKPYFMLPKDADVVSCYVQQTGDHMFLWMIQNQFHCCAFSGVEKRDGSTEHFRFWRDGQEMEQTSEKLLPHQDASHFIKVYFSAKD